MLRLYLTTGTVLIDHRASLAPAQTVGCLESEDEVRKLLLNALSDRTALDPLRRFWAKWRSKRVDAVSDRMLIDWIARMTVRGPLVAFLISDRRTLLLDDVAEKFKFREPQHS